jgi:hypothetical protein
MLPVEFVYNAWESFRGVCGNHFGGLLERRERLQERREIEIDSA